MNLVCIMFDDLYDDTDIIAVPDKIFENVEELGQHFQYWLARGEHDNCQIIPDGQRILVGETAGFVKWLNNHVLTNSDELVEIIEEHVQYRPDLKAVEF